MLRLTPLRASKRPFNAGVAPRYDVWFEKYEPWTHMKRMARMVGTGFYIPPDWYSHFRMFPPIQNNFPQEKTLNMRNDAEPTQSQLDSAQDAQRKALRDELARGSRSLAAAGKRYYNLFWVQKPLDEMERKYYALQRKGIRHDVAIRRVLTEYYEGLAVKKRVQLIQAEEAKLSGNFITMREAMTVLKVLSQVQEAQLAPHQYAQLAERTAAATESGPLRDAMIERASRASATVIHPDAAPPTDGAPAAAAAAAAAAPGESAAAAGSSSATSSGAPVTTPVPMQPPAEGTAEALMFMLNSDEGRGASDAAGSTSKPKLEAKTKTPTSNNLPLLREQATDGTGEADWYDGFDILLDPATPSGGGPAK